MIQKTKLAETLKHTLQCDREIKEGRLSRKVGLETISKIQDNVECYREKKSERESEEECLCVTIY